MKIATLALVLLSMISGVTAESVNVPVESNNDIPFYLKLSDTNPDSVIAVVYYGELGDESKEIDVPCAMKGSSASSDKYVGPESVTCQCEAIRRGCSGWGSSHSKVINNSKCQLQVPFQFEHDANGTITSVTFIKDNANSTSSDDILIVPFYPQKDRNGNIIAVEVSANEAAQQSSSSTAESAISLLLLFIIIVGSIILIVSLVRIVQNLIQRNAAKETASSTGINPMNVKNMADLENPEPHRRSTNMNRNNHDDDTATDDSSSDN